MPMNPWLSVPSVILLVLFFTGYGIGEFLFRRRPTEEVRPAQLGAHLLIVFACHTALLLPFMAGEFRTLGVMLFLLLVLALLHAAIDLSMGVVRRRWKAESLALFLTGQVVHGVTVLAAWWTWLILVGAKPGALAPPDLVTFAAAALVVLAYVLNGQAAATLIHLFLKRFPVTQKTDIQGMGRIIGILERMLLFTLVAMGQWEAVGWVFAGKTVARFRELNDRAFSEYYLIGTLSSILFSATTGLGVRLALLGSL